MPNSTTFSNRFLDAVLSLKCPPRHKEVLLALVRLVGGNYSDPRAVPINIIAGYLGQDKSHIAKRLNDLIYCNVIKETRRPGYNAPRQLVVNIHYKEWRPLLPVAKRKSHSAGPSFWADKMASLERNSQESESKKRQNEKKIQNPNESATVAKSASPQNRPEIEVDKALMEFRLRELNKLFGLHPYFEERYELRKLIFSEKLPQKNTSLPNPNASSTRGP